MILDTTKDDYPIVTSLKFRLLLSLLGKGALIQYKGKLYQARVYEVSKVCPYCSFKSLNICIQNHLYDLCGNIEDAYEKTNGEKVSVGFTRYIGKLPPDEIVVVF